MKPVTVATRLWFLTSLCFGAGASVVSLWNDGFMAPAVLIFATIAALVCSLPAFAVLYISLAAINKWFYTVTSKFMVLVLLQLLITIGYGLLAGIIDTSFNYDDNAWMNFLETAGLSTAALFACSAAATAMSYKKISIYFSQDIPFQIQTNTNMDTYQQNLQTQVTQPSASNKIMIKAIVTGVLILVMLIPTVFVSNLVTERQERQKEVVEEVSSKWATPQTVTGPWLYIPYTINATGADGKIEKLERHLILLPENLTVAANMLPEERPRSIYKVLLYKSTATAKGNFILQLPKDIDTASLQLSEARICMGVTDFKGIEEKIAINFNGNLIDLLPGLPSKDIDSNGLSATINLSAPDFNKTLAFDMSLKIKGSEQLHFVPLAGNSNFNIQSSWSNPSFDGNTLPGEREVTDSGFNAKWTFNKANLPFATTLKDFNFKKDDFAFGVTMVQPADQYAKTMRSVKYAILFIGLTFCLFFIVELMQKKAFHPVQYVLVGIALIIFFTLLLSISEFLLFDTAYLIAASATVLLITLYAKGHFESWKTASVFAGILGSLYGFIFILIRLEDTALLVGSIGLFAVLAIVMYVSRKINWYNPSFQNTAIETI